MPIPNTLPLSDIIDVLVSVASSGVAGPTFNIGLILDTEGIIPTVGANARIREYTSGSWSESMIADGFGLTSKAYIAAGLYFSQKSQPRILYVGAQDKTAGGIVSAKINAAGTGYAVGDVLTPTQAGSSGGEFTVTQVDSNGAIIQGYVSAQGDTYSVALALPTTVAPVGGTGATIDIEAVGPETLVQAAAACRIANYNWYGFYVPGAETADHLLLAAWAQAASPQVQYFLNTADATVPGGIAGNLFATLYGAKYDRTIGIYSTTQNGAYPNNNYAGAALMGQAMGLFTGLSGCAFTLMGKPLTGIYTEPITETSLSYIHSVGGNVYVSRQNAYSEV